jgi:serine/threonine protein kinase
VSLYDAASEIVIAALDLAGVARAELVDERCRGDEALKAEVQSLLAAHERSGGFLEQPLSIGPYKIIRLLGEGGMGRVYLAEDTRLGRKVALKAIAKRIAHDEKSRERLRREAQIAAALAHPNIAIVYALEEIDGDLFIVSEYIQGETLRDAIDRGPMPLEDVLSIGRQLATALAAAHDAGVIHRDLKPENVMRTPDGAVKILDFGLAKATGTNEAVATADAVHLTAAGAVFGTPAYMSPEQLRGEPGGRASDIFALGIVLAEISGAHPFGGRGASTLAKILTAEPDLGGVPAALRPVVAGCVAKISEERYRSAHEVRAALDTVARGGIVRLRDRATAFWWWQFHQACACVFSAALIVCVWLALGRLPYEFALRILISALIGGTTATTLRLYLLFAARTRPEDSPPLRVAIAARTADVSLAWGTFASGYFQTTAHPIEAGLLMAAAVVLVVLSLVIEPAAARAAHR